CGKKCWLSVREKRPYRFTIRTLGRHRYKFLLRIAQRCQLSTKDAAGVEVDRSVQPLGFRNGRVLINHNRRPAIFSRPVVSHWQAELVRFASRLAIESELANAT